MVFKASYEDLSFCYYSPGLWCHIWGLSTLSPREDFWVCETLSHLWVALPVVEVLTRSCLCLSYPKLCIFFLSFFTSLVAEELYSVVFRSFSEKVVLLVCWEEVNSRYFYSVILICPQERKHILNIVSKAPDKINIFWVNKNL